MTLSRLIKENTAVQTNGFTSSKWGCSTKSMDVACSD